MNRSSVGAFVDYVKDTGCTLKLEYNEATENPFPTTAQFLEPMHKLYTDHCKAMDNQFKVGADGFKHEMKRLENDEPDFPFTYKKTTGGRMGWVVDPSMIGLRKDDAQGDLFATTGNKVLDLSERLKKYKDYNVGRGGQS